jgi:hypothetical protein
MSKMNQYENILTLIREVVFSVLKLVGQNHTGKTLVRRLTHSGNLSIFHSRSREVHELIRF